jgi:hypothetical protein
MKLYHSVKKLLVGYTHMHKQTDIKTGDLKSLLSFLESRLKTNLGQTQHEDIK